MLLFLCIFVVFHFSVFDTYTSLDVGIHLPVIEAYTYTQFYLFTYIYRLPSKASDGIWKNHYTGHEAGFHGSSKPAAALRTDVRQ